MATVAVEKTVINLDKYANILTGPYWVPLISETIPSNPLVGGREGNKELLVGRCRACGDLLPGKIFKGEKSCLVSWGGGQYKKEDCEILINVPGWEFDWVQDSGGNVPANAVQGGATSDGEELYVGRAEHDGHLIPGKIHPSHKCLYLPFDGKEHGHNPYWVLVRKPV